MTRDISAGQERDDVTRDGPWLVVPTIAGALRILTGDPPDLAGLLDVEVLTHDCRRYVGTVGTLSNITAAMARWKGTGEGLGGRYFWARDLVLVASTDVDTLAEIVDDLASTGELAGAFSLVTDD